MTAIAHPLPDDVRAARDGILAFVDAEVIPRHADNRPLFDNPRRLFDEDGRHSAQALALINEVRQLSAKAGTTRCAFPSRSAGQG